MKKTIISIIIIILLVILALIATPSIAKYILKTLYPVKYDNLVTRYSSQYNLDPHFVYGVIKTESNFDEDAISNKDARGLMQIAQSTGKWGADSLGIKNYNPKLLLKAKYNIRIGCWYLYKLSKEFDNDMTKVLAAYNGGSGNVNRWVKDKSFSNDGIKLKRTPFPETNKFIEKVKRAYNIYNYLYPKEK